MVKDTWLEPVVWFVFAAAPITMLCLGMYAVGQQGYRQGANDPQIQIAEDGAARLNGGEVPAALVQRGAPLIDIENSLAPWVAVYDSTGLPLQSSAQFENAPPKLPAGVFDTANARAQVDDPIWIQGEYKVTWQPTLGVRQAVVVVQTKDKKYFVAAGRSLRLAEERTGMLGFNMLIGWLGVLAVTFVLSFIGWFLLRR